VTLEILQQAHAVERDEISETWSFALLDTASVLAHYMETVRGIDAETARLRAIMLIALLDRFWFFQRLPGVETEPETTLDALTDFWWTAFSPRGCL